MADKKISELVVATSSLSTDQLVIRRDSSNFSLAVGLVSTSGSSGTPTDTGSLVTTSSISGTTQTFTKGDGSTYTNEITNTETASYFNTDPISASLTVTDNLIRQSITDLSASLTTTDQTISLSVSSLSSSAASARNDLSASFAASSDTYSASHAVYLESNFIQTVNAVGPDANGNVGVSLTSVSTGLSSSFPVTPTDGDVYVISGETAPDKTGSNGESFIYSDDSSEWFKLSGLDLAGQDARYVNQSGDTMTGNLFLNGNPTLANQAANKQYTDLFYDSSSFGSSGNVLALHKGNGTVDSITIVSSSYSVTSSHAITASHALDAVTASFAQTASSVLHLEQDVFISGTLYQSGSVEMNQFPINDLLWPTTTSQATSKEYVDNIKLDQQYPIFDLDLNEAYLEQTPSYGERTFTGIAVYSGSRSFLYAQPNSAGSSVQSLREWDGVAEDWDSSTFASVTVKRYSRGVVQFNSGSDIYLNVLHGEGGIYTIKWEGSTLTNVQNITTPGAGEINNDRYFTLSKTDNEEGLAVYNETTTTDWVAFKWKTGSFSPTEHSVSASPSNVTQVCSTCVVHYDGDYYFNTWDETNDQASIYKFEYSTDTFTRVVTLPVQSKGVGGSYLAARFWESDGTLYLAHGTEEVETEIFEIDVINQTYKSLGKSPYVIEALGMGILGDSNKTNVGVSYFGGSNPANNTMQYFKFDPSNKSITDLGTKSINGGSGAILTSPSFLESNGELFPTTPNYRRFIYTTHKLEKELDYKEGTILLATAGNWLRSGQVSSSIQLPTGNTSERPTNVSQGSIRFNTNTQKVEVFNSASNWVSL